MSALFPTAAHETARSVLSRLEESRRSGVASAAPSRLHRFLMEQENDVRAGRAPNGLWFPHQDSKGLWTTGFGHLIGDGSSAQGEGGRFALGITDKEVRDLLDRDVQDRGVTPAKRAVGAARFDALPEWGKALLTEFAYSLGPEFHKRDMSDGRKGFPSMTKAVLKGDFDKAVKEASDRTAGGVPLTRRTKALVKMLEALRDE